MRVALPLMVAGAAVVLRLPAIEMPLDRDQAAYATIGQNLFGGVLPYRDLFDHKQPLSYLVYAFLDLIAPYSTVAVRLAAAAAGATTAWLVHQLLLPLGARRAAAGALIALVWGASQVVEGESLNTEQVLAPAAVGAVLAAVRWGDRMTPRRAFAIGALGGLVILAKAVGAFVLPALLVAALWHRTRRRLHAAWLLAGVAAPLVVLAALYTALGALHDLWYANVVYNRLYLGSDRFARPDRLGILLLVVPAFAVAARLLLARPSDRLAWVLGTWLAGAIVGASLGRGYPHYYATVVAPAAALLAAVPAGRLVRTQTVAAGLALVLVVPALELADLWRHPGYQQAERTYGASAVWWRDAEVLGPVIRRAAAPGDRLYAVGTEPNFYWQSGLRPASRTLYAMPAGPLRERVRRDVCARPPRFLVRQRGAPETYEPACLSREPYVAVARHGLSVVFELRER